MTSKDKSRQRRNAGVPPLRFAPVGMTDSFVGMTGKNRQRRNAGVPPLRFAPVGMTGSFVGITDSFVGMTDSFVGMTDSFVGMTGSGRCARMTSLGSFLGFSS
jgi:hypothetical protein